MNELIDVFVVAVIDAVDISDPDDFSFIDHGDAVADASSTFARNRNEAVAASALEVELMLRVPPRATATKRAR